MINFTTCSEKVVYINTDQIVFIELCTYEQEDLDEKHVVLVQTTTRCFESKLKNMEDATKEINRLLKLIETVSRKAQINYISSALHEATYIRREIRDSLKQIQNTMSKYHYLETKALKVFE